MGRKMKSLAALFVILGLIYWQQASAVRPAYAKEEGSREWYETSEKPDKEPIAGEGETEEIETGKGETLPEGPGENPSEGSGENPPEGSGENQPEGPGENPPEGPEENPSEGSGENPPEGSGENPPKEPEDGDDLECFQSVILPEDGENGYYVTRPWAEIRHVSRKGITRYCFTDGKGHKEEGELAEEGDTFRIRKDQFREGANHLSVWMEDDRGKRQEEYLLEKTFLIDTTPPAVRIQAPMGTDAWYQKEVFINVFGEDGESGSQIEEISCFLGTQEIGNSRKSSAGFLISFASNKGAPVPVRVRVKDRAGNTAEEMCGLYIDQHAPRTSMEGISDYMITSQPVRVEYRVEEENLLGEMEAGARREAPDGEIEFLAAEEWMEQETGYSAGQVFDKDGIYQLNVSARDQAGYTSSSKGQVIIDSEDPVIRHVDEVDGQYLKSFCWEYPIEEVVQDFTSYTYSVYLDGRPYHIGENILREGKHVLEVHAQDSAGNIGRAEADFAIDRTAPQIIFADVEKGQTYEPEKAVGISLKDQEDFIEEIRINGRLQETGEKKKEYSYSIQECGNYEIQVKASDRAGNQTVSCVDFVIEQKKGLLHKFAGPIKKMLGDPFWAEKKEPAVQEGSTAPKESKAYPIWLIIPGAAIAGGGAAVIRQRKKAADIRTAAERLAAWIMGRAKTGKVGSDLKKWL